MEVSKLTNNLFSVSFRKRKDKSDDQTSVGNKTENNNLVNRIYIIYKKFGMGETKPFFNLDLFFFEARAFRISMKYRNHHRGA